MVVAGVVVASSGQISTFDLTRPWSRARSRRCTLAYGPQRAQVTRSSWKSVGKSTNRVCSVLGIGGSSEDAL